MCRLYACRAGVVVEAKLALLDAPHALIRQSCRDRFGETHADGWGIGCYVNGAPRVERSTIPAFEDPTFAAAASRCHGQTILAHVRAGSVGTRVLENTHPFVFGRWLFAHNGTVTAFDRVGPSLERETSPALLAARRGSTDSELVFCWLLGRMQRAGIEMQGPTDCPRLREVMAAAVVELAARSAQAGAAEPAGLNLVLTDGDVMIATRWGRSLSWGAADGVVHVASEPPWPGDWQEMPKFGLISVDRDLRVTVSPLATAAG